MKKLLALVMALVMTLGLATVAANAAYPDAADVELKEAVEVMTAVGVFKGDENGNFKPQANLDRAAAAKLIAYLDLGEKAAEALPAVKAFNDVPATHWAAKYIAYCANAGYVAGAGDGNFYPSNPLTGYAFGKMVLCVLGYDATIEGFTGATWSINVAKLMDSNDIADGVDGAASANLTREQAAQYCLNALKADMVEYDTKGTSIEINGAKIATGASKAEPKTTKSSDAKYEAIDNTASGDEVIQLGEKLYSGDLKVTSTTNDFNADATKWTYKNSTVGTYADAPTVVYNNKVTKGTIYTLLGKDVYDDLKAGNAMLYLSTDGSALASDGVTNVVKGSSGAAFGTGNGTVTEVYVDEDAIGGTYAEVKVIVKNTYVMQATDDYNAKTEKLVVDDISGMAKATLTADDVADGVDLEGFKEDDFILYTVAGGKVQSMEKATTVSGKVNSYATGSNVTIDGTKYSYSKKIDLETDNKHNSSVKYSTGETATVVLDAQGYIIYVDEMTAANDNVVFVLSTGTSGFDPIAKILTVDGKKSTVTVAKKSDTVAADKVFAYKVDGSEYKLTNYDAAKWGTAAAGTYTLYKTTSVFGKKATADTVYIVEDDDGDITMYTGVKNAPETVVTSKTVLFVNNTDNELTYVYVVADGGVDEHSTASDELIYVLKVGDTDKPFVDSDDNQYVEVTALVDGAKTTLNVELDYAKTLAVGNFFTKKTTNSDGYVTKMTAATVGDDYASFTVASKDNAFTYSSDVFDAAGSSWYVNADKVYAVVTGGALLEDPAASYELTETTFKGLQNFVKGYNVTANGWVVLNDDGEATAAYVLITDSAVI